MDSSTKDFTSDSHVNHVNEGSDRSDLDIDHVYQEDGPSGVGISIGGLEGLKAIDSLI